MVENFGISQFLVSLLTAKRDRNFQPFLQKAVEFCEIRPNFETVTGMHGLIEYALSGKDVHKQCHIAIFHTVDLSIQKKNILKRATLPITNNQRYVTVSIVTHKTVKWR